MTGPKISELPTATTLAGTELVAGVQTATTVSMTADQIRRLPDVSDDGTTITATAPVLIDVAVVYASDELLSNPTFLANDTGWTYCADCTTWSSGAFVSTYDTACDTGCADLTIAADFASVSGSTYLVRVEFTISGDQQSIYFNNNSTGSYAPSATSPQDLVFVADYTGTDQVVVDFWDYNTDATRTVTSVSVREITVADAFTVNGQGGTPILRIDPIYGHVVLDNGGSAFSNDQPYGGVVRGTNYPSGSGLTGGDIILHGGIGDGTFFSGGSVSIRSGFKYDQNDNASSYIGAGAPNATTAGAVGMQGGGNDGTSVYGGQAFVVGGTGSAPFYPAGPATLRGGDNFTSDDGGQVNIDGGPAYGGGVGGGVYVEGGQSQGGDGGVLYLAGGYSFSGDGDGGNATLFGGYASGSGAGGSLVVQGGSAAETGSSAGALYLNGGSGQNSDGAGSFIHMTGGSGGFGGGDTDGGEITIRGGYAGLGDGSGGNVSIIGGVGLGTGDGGTLVVTGGQSGTSSGSAAGPVVITGGIGNSTTTAGADVRVVGGEAGSGGTTAGGAVTLTGGNGPGAGNGNGGAITIQGGAGTGTGVQGTITLNGPIFFTNSTAIDITTSGIAHSLTLATPATGGASSNSGNVYLTTGNTGGANSSCGDLIVTLGAKTGGGTGRRGHLFLTNLPTSDPGISGAIWNSSGTLKISP